MTIPAIADFDRGGRFVQLNGANIDDPGTKLKKCALKHPDFPTGTILKKQALKR